MLRKLSRRGRIEQKALEEDASDLSLRAGRPQEIDDARPDEALVERARWHLHGAEVGTEDLAGAFEIARLIGRDADAGDHAALLGLPEPVRDRLGLVIREVVPIVHEAGMHLRYA